MTIRFLLRAMKHHFILPSLRNGPFIVQATDLSQSNIFVDKDWNVTCLIDLEWICALPVEMLSVPYWFAPNDLSDNIEDRYDRFSIEREKFLPILNEELHSAPLGHQLEITSVIERMWASKGVWFWACIESVNA